jgi:hypothetical protein
MAHIPACFIIDQETGEVVASQTWVPNEHFNAVLEDLRKKNPQKTYITENGFCDVELVDLRFKFIFHSNPTV